MFVIDHKQEKLFFEKLVTLDSFKHLFFFKNFEILLALFLILI